jgi:hypothetical protein
VAPGDRLCPAEDMDLLASFRFQIAQIRPDVDCLARPRCSGFDISMGVFCSES